MADTRPVFFFDIDNCLYPKSRRVHDHMAELIDDYFMRHLNLDRDEAYRLHTEYYTNYGLAIEGLVRHHEIDALEYNREVDDALPLESIIFPDPLLRNMLQDMDKSKVKLWLFTNAYVNHGKRVVRLLGVDDLFEGLTFCDYGQRPLICKPHEEMFQKAMKEAGVTDVKKCYFVDDSAMNCRKAQEIGWTSAHLVEGVDPLPAVPAGNYQIRYLNELRTLFPQFFKSS
ncbi:HAD-like protein [Venustampulla echinocandica]|uniref:HAD-like protein n=1 Tax=Venustampulla echinocandica TaxID=2656787 RepID=A0A370TJK7_9HELO|nr:HAD-like protein [Venustampulla echinocandica]RDL35711.1 HAD-like protein [Venustampulla echinocandica]